jgi:transposase
MKELVQPTPLVSEDAKRRGGSRSEPSRSEAAFETTAPDPEVSAKASRRRFSASYKLRILEEADQCEHFGAVGLLLRREGIHSSHLANWRKARREGSLAQLGQKRGRKPKVSAEQKKILQLERENRRLKDQLDKAEMILDVQGKVARLLGLKSSDGRSLS